MKFSAKYPYPSGEQWIGFYMIPVAVVMLLVSMLFCTVQFLSTFDARLLLITEGLCLVAAVVGGTLIARAKLANFKRGVWLSFGAESLVLSYRNSYRIGRAMLLTGFVIFWLINFALKP